MDTLYAITIFPIELLYKVVYLWLYSLVNNYGFALLLLSILSFFFMKPFEAYVSKFQKREQDIQSVIQPQLAKIKAESKGAEQHQRINNLYKRYSYHPIMSLRGSIGLLVQVPFLMAAYFMLSSLTQLQGQSFGFIADLSKPDALLWGINFLPFIMTLINCLSVYYYGEKTHFKDKIQLYGMAFFFLIILYAAPSALIIYWTFNNALGLLKNLTINSKLIVSSRALFSSLKILLARPLQSLISNKYIKKYLNSFAVTFLPFFIIFIAGGTSLYANNIFENDMNFPFSQLLPILMEKSLYIALILSVVLFLLPYKNNIYERACAFIFSIAIALFIEGNILSSNYSVLDGTEELKFFSANNMISVFTWMFVLAFIQYFYKKINIKKALSVMACLAIISPLITLHTYQADIDKKERAKPLQFVVDEEFFNFSAESNTIIMILDSMTGQVVEEIFEDPEYKNIIDGFYWMKDFTATAVNTKGSEPQIYGARPFDNSIPFDEYLKDVENEQVFSIYKDMGYTVKYFHGTPIINRNPSLFDNLMPYIIYDSKVWSSIYKLVQFSFFPHFLKEFTFKTIYPTHIWDYAMLEAYQNIPFKVESDKPVLLTIFLLGGHKPFEINEDFTYNKNSTEIAKSKASLKMFKIFLDKLKELGVFEKSTIILTSDHTQHGTGDKNQYVLAAVKPFGVNKGVKELNVPLSNKEIKKILLDQENGITLDKEYFESIKNTNRTFIAYTWRNDWHKQYFSQLELVQVKGHAKDASQYVRPGIFFEPHRKTLEYGKTYIFPQDYDKVKDFISAQFINTDEGLLSPLNPFRNAFDGRMTGDDLPNLIEVVFNCVKYSEDKASSESVQVREVIFPPYRVSIALPYEELIVKEMLSRPYIINAGSKILFNDPNNRALLISNWSNAEAWGTWSDGKQPSIIAKFNPETKAIFFQLAHVYGEQDVTISANGVEVYSETNIKPNSEIIINFPESILADIKAGKAIEFIFDIPKAVSPKSLGKSEEPRELGIGLVSITAYDKVYDKYTKLENLPIGDPISGDTLSKAIMLQDGFSGQENWGRWTDGKKATLVAKFNPETKAIFFKLAHVYGEQDVTISANGVKVYSETNIKPNSEIIINFPEAVLADIKAGKVIEFVFDIPKAVSPKSLGKSGDSRELGIGLVSIEVLADEAFKIIR